MASVAYGALWREENPWSLAPCALSSARTCRCSPEQQPGLEMPHDCLVPLPEPAPCRASRGYPGITHCKILCAEFLIQEEVIRESNNLSWHTEHSRILLLGKHQEQN